MARYTEQHERIPLDGLPLLVGRSPEADLYLSDRNISRCHARLEQRGEEVWVVELGSSHGTFVNEVKVNERVLESEDRIRFGHHMQYRMRVGEKCLERLGRAGMALDLEDVTISTGRRLLLEGIRLRIPPGSFMGVLGPSGAGKTMLLRLLGGIRPPSNGRIRTNFQEDIWQDIEQHRNRLAFIPQRDILYSHLTVREHLECAARLRWGRNASDQSYRERIEQTLSMLGLERHAGQARRCAQRRTGQACQCGDGMASEAGASFTRRTHRRTGSGKRSPAHGATGIVGPARQHGSLRHASHGECSPVRAGGGGSDRRTARGVGVCGVAAKAVATFRMPALRRSVRTVGIRTVANGKSLGRRGPVGASHGSGWRRTWTAVPSVAVKAAYGGGHLDKQFDRSGTAPEAPGADRPCGESLGRRRPGDRQARHQTGLAIRRLGHSVEVIDERGVPCRARPRRCRIG